MACQLFRASSTEKQRFWEERWTEAKDGQKRKCGYDSRSNSEEFSANSTKSISK